MLETKCVDDKIEILVTVTNIKILPTSMLVTDVGDEMFWRQFWDVGYDFGGFRHQHPLSLNIDIGYQHAKDVANIEIPSLISERCHRYRNLTQQFIINIKSPTSACHQHQCSPRYWFCHQQRRLSPAVCRQHNDVSNIIVAGTEFNGWASTLTWMVQVKCSSVQSVSCQVQQNFRVDYLVNWAFWYQEEYFSEFE